MANNFYNFGQRKQSHESCFPPKKTQPSRAQRSHSQVIPLDDREMPVTILNQDSKLLHQI